MTNTKTHSKEILMGFELEVKALNWKCIRNRTEWVELVSWSTGACRMAAAKSEAGFCFHQRLWSTRSRSMRGAALDEGSATKNYYGWWKKSGRFTSWYGKYPLIYRVLYIPGGCLGFLPSTVWLQRITIRLLLQIVLLRSVSLYFGKSFGVWTWINPGEVSIGGIQNHEVSSQSSLSWMILSSLLEVGIYIYIDILKAT